MMKRISLAAVSLSFLPGIGNAEPPVWRDYWGQIEKSYPSSPGGWQTFVTDTGCVTLTGDRTRWMLFRMTPETDLLDVSLGGKDTDAFGDPFEELPDGKEDNSIYLRFDESTVFKAEIVSWEYTEYALEFPLGISRSLFEIAESLTAVRANQERGVTFSLKGASLGLMMHERCVMLTEALKIIRE